MSKEYYVAPSVKVIPNAFPQHEEFLKMALDAPPEAWLESQIDGDFRGEDDAIRYEPGFRRSRELPIPHGLMYPRVFYDVAYTIHEQASIYAKENGFGFNHMEQLSLLEYLPNQDFFDRHNDTGPNQPRACSALLYFNDVDQGGETYFDKFELTIRPKAGTLALFPANYPYSHQAFPPISNTKYVMITFFGMQLNRDVFDRYYPKYDPKFDPTHAH